MMKLLNCVPLAITGSILLLTPKFMRRGFLFAVAYRHGSFATDHLLCDEEGRRTIRPARKNTRSLLERWRYLSQSHDMALVVEKRDGFGYTLNFGNGLSWLLADGLLLVLASIPLVLFQIGDGDSTFAYPIIPKFAVAKFPMFGKITGKLPAPTPNHCASVPPY